MINRTQTEITDTWIGDFNKPLVSIVCLTYNHEAYISQAIESFLMQKTDFPFEVLIHDDASTDKTADIIKQYEKKFSKIIKPIYQTENQHSQGNSVTKITLARAKGEFIAFCEGDDFWINPHKLQKQVNFLKQNPHCILCASKSKIYNDTEPTDTILPKEQGNRFISLEEIIEKGAILAPTQTRVVRKDAVDSYWDFKLKCTIGDYPMLLYWGHVGKVYLLDDVFSVYRQNALNSWCSRQKKSFSIKKKNIFSVIKMLNAFNAQTHYKYNNNILKKKIDMLPLRISSLDLLPNVFSGKLTNIFLFLPYTVKKILQKGCRS